MTRLEDALREALDSGVDGGTGSMLADVRRGARRRRARRRAVGAVVAASALVAGVVVGGSLLGGETDTAPDPAPRPSDSTSSSAPPQADVPTTIPDGYPLAAGLPTRAEPGHAGLEGPNRTMPALTFETCGSALADPPHEDRFRVSYQNPEDLRDRQLTTYADTDAAVAAVEQIVDIYRACPTETDPADADQGRTHEVRRTSVGREWWAIVTSPVMFGEPAVGLTVTHVIQVGLAVLVLQESNEGGMSDDREAEIQRYLDRMTTRATESIAALCRFTASGC